MKSNTKGKATKKLSKNRIEDGPVPNLLGLDEFYARRLAEMSRAWEAGNVFGLTDAVLLCDDEGIPLPRWALRVLARMIRGTLAGQKPRRGPHRPIAKSLGDLRDFSRYEAVEECREHREKDHDRDSNDCFILKVKGRDIFQQASILLSGVKDFAGNHVGGSDEVIKQSYYKVKRNLKLNPDRYYLCAYLNRYRPEPRRSSEAALVALTNFIDGRLDVRRPRSSNRPVS
jgi:hypothetical protein